MVKILIIYFATFVMSSNAMLQTLPKLFYENHPTIFSAIASRDACFVQQVLEAKEATVHDVCQFTTETPLHCAVRLSKNDIVGVLLAEGASTDATDCWGRSPLDYAAQYGRVELVRTLLAAGARVRPNFGGIFCADGHTEIIRLLQAARVAQRAIIKK